MSLSVRWQENITQILSPPWVIKVGDAVTIHDTLVNAGTALSAVSDTPMLDAEILLACVLGQPRSYLRAWSTAELTEAQSRLFAGLLQRRLQREPIAYLTGHKEFWSLDLKVNSGTLIPRPETELLIEAVLECFPKKNQHIIAADLGTGSGAIALALASERPLWDIHAVDNSEIALSAASDNAQRLGFKRISFNLGNWFTALPVRTLDLVVSNPPYLSEREWSTYAAGLAFEPPSALLSGEDGLQAIREICGQAGHYIRPGGYLMIEHGFLQGASVRALLVAAGCHQIRTLVDIAGQDRVTIGQF